MEECSITIDGRNKNTLSGIVVYMSKPEGIEDLVNNLFDIALTKGSKIYFVTINLYDHMASNERTYRDSLASIKEAYEKREQILIQKFKDHPKVKPLLEGGKTLVITPATSVFCELE
jgi:flavin-dependent dehydrogenase